MTTSCNTWKGLATVIGAALLACGCASYGAPASSDGATIARDLGIPATSPESVGFDTARLNILRSEFRKLVDEEKLAGAVTLVARHGKVVHFDAYGSANRSTGEILKPDSIFRIASMTKPVTGVAMMQLWEQGKWRLSDPVSKYIPEFASLKVRGPNGSLVEQTQPMTMAQLMSHTAGFGVSALYDRANLGATDLQGMIDKLSRLPLETQPGTAWDYGPSVNIQGYIVEKLSGQSLDAYFSQHIFQPLGMTDTGFWTPPEKAQRVVAVHTYENGKVKGPPENRVTSARPSFLAGSGGLMSTARDYWLFAQSIANGGEIGGRRILKSETIKLMRTNVLQPGVKVDLYGPSQEGIGFGLDFAIVMDPQRARSPQGINTFYWGGAFGTWFWIDPTNDLIFVGMIQNLNGSTPTGGTPPVRTLSADLTYAALTRPEK